VRHAPGAESPRQVSSRRSTRQEAPTEAEAARTLEVTPASEVTWTSESGTTSDLYATGFDASWELDIFGGVRRSVEAAQANLEASRENMRDVLVTLLAEVAKGYVDVRTYQARIAIAEENLKTQEETYQMTVWRNEAGLSDQLAVQQARYNLENTRSNMPTLRTGLEEVMNSIAVLLGEQPGKVHEELSKRNPYRLRRRTSQWACLQTS